MCLGYLQLFMRRRRGAPTRCWCAICRVVTHLPSMSIMSFGSFLALLIVGLVYLPRIQWRAFGNRKLLFFALVVVARGVSNILATRFTLAIYVQLITLLTPFIVALLSTAVLREKLPRYTIQAMMLSVLGAVMLIGGSISGVDGFPTANRTDWLGISLALGGSLLLAIYMVAIRGSVRSHIRGETMLLCSFFLWLSATGVISLLFGEDWSRWGSMQPFDWLIFGMVVLGVFTGANMSQIGAIRHLGAAVVSSTMAWRLVSTLFLAGLLLDEHLSSVWQVLGVVLVLTTVTWYLWRQRS